LKYLKLLGWLALYFAIYLCSTLVGGMVLAGAYFISSLLAGRFLPMDAYMASNLTVSLIIAAVLTLVCGYFVLLIRGYKPLEYLKFRAMPAKHTALMALMGASFAVFVNSFLTLIQVDRFLPDYVSHPLVEMITANLPLTFLAIGIFVPVYEEFLVRGLMFKELKRNINFKVALVLQGLIFGLMHGNVLQFSYAFPMGVLLGYIYTKYQSLWAPILIHLVWNSSSLLMGATMPEGVSFETFLLLMSLSGLVFVGGIVYSIKLPAASPEQLA
jgi:membrane protease YdiL (CAAX protease family)